MTANHKPRLDNEIKKSRPGLAGGDAETGRDIGGSIMYLFLKDVDVLECNL